MDFEWPDPALYYALLTEKLVKNGSKYVKISGPNPTRAQYGQPEPDPGQKKSGPTQPYQCLALRSWDYTETETLLFYITHDSKL